MTPSRVLHTGTDHVLARVMDGIGMVVLNRPERRNALSRPMLAGLAEVLVELDEAPDVGAVVLTGAGGAFCAGGDVKAFADQGGAGGGAEESIDDRARQQRAMQHATTGKLYTMSTPTVAALPGAAAGAGLGLALACDLRVGCSRTLVATAFVKVGLAGDYGVAWLLNAIVGPSRARRLMFLGERLTGEQAHEWGLLDWLVGDDDVERQALDVARAIATGPRGALAAMKMNLLDAATHDLTAAMDFEVPRHLRSARTDDHREAVRAFVEKRTPRFAGNMSE